MKETKLVFIVAMSFALIFLTSYVLHRTPVESWIFIPLGLSLFIFCIISIAISIHKLVKYFL